MAKLVNNYEDKQKRLPYASPAIIYEGQVTARAGSLSPADPPADIGGAGNEGGVQPVDLFGSGGNG